MIVEQRTYRFKAGKVPAFLAIYEEKGLEVQKRILGHLIGYYVTEIADNNEPLRMTYFIEFKNNQFRGVFGRK